MISKLAGNFPLTAGIFAVSVLAIAALARLLMGYSSILAGAWLGTGLAGLTAVILWPWKKQARQFHREPTARVASLANLSLWASLLRLACLVTMAWWGFHSSLTLGLAGIISFGFAFLLATSLEFISMGRRT
ncbi:MAG: hypothetical protein AAB091_01300 [Elusimicrobiota bacterium]